MKLNILSITLLCVSAVIADSMEEPLPLVKILVGMFEDSIDNFEKNTPGWDSTVSLEKNVLTFVDKSLESGSLPGWNTGSSFKDNLVNAFIAYIESLEIGSFDVSKPFTENLWYAVAKFLRSVEFPFWLPRLSIQEQMVQHLGSRLDDTKVSGFNVNKSFKEDVVAWVEAAIVGIQESEPIEEAVNAAVKNALKQLKIPGFSPSKTLKKNVAGVTPNIFYF